MPRTKDYKKLSDKLQKEVAELKKQIKAQFAKGFAAAQVEMEKIEDAFEKHMHKAARVFEKQIATKQKKTPKAKPATAKAKKDAPKKGRGRPAKKTK